MPVVDSDDKESLSPDNKSIRSVFVLSIKSSSEQQQQQQNHQSCWIEGKWRLFLMLWMKEKVDIRPAEECAGVAPAGEECTQGEFERARLRSLVHVTANVQLIPSNGRTKKNWIVCDLQGCLWMTNDLYGWQMI
jgi:hypothetical protein